MSQPLQAEKGVGAEFMVMETSSNEVAQEHFHTGLALLHNFEYGRAAAAFRLAQEADPDFVMAYWGEAMTYNHPLWEFRDVERARDALAKLALTPEARSAKVRNSRERLWLDAVETLYSDGPKEERDHAYLAKMRAMLEADPDDIDARAFTGLAVLGTSHGGRQIPLYMEAAGILEEGFMAHEMHPGILHYMIHSYDDPVHAPLGERPAARYAKVAPNAGHAQHMVSHIFHALGDWERSEAANINADAVVDRQLAERGRDPTFCGHYNEWLAYALIQQGKDASEMVEGCRAEAVAEVAAGRDYGKIGGYRSDSSSFGTIALHAGVTSGVWAEPVGWPEDRFLKAQFNLAYASLLQSRDDPVAAATALDRMKAIHGKILRALPDEMPDETAIPSWNERIIAQGEAIVTLAGGNSEVGLALLEAAAEAEAAMPVVFGPPAIEKPSYEMLGEELLALGRSSKAAGAFQKALAFSPGRYLSLKGLEAARASTSREIGS
ncbi:hypothetical protein [Altererythrobacter sp. MF3-039]|uniref:hypothetical protein n=1 Tax=Altererythrobacter sp. MF3-039 TaxID=3252901 RepID=UPI00390CBA2F